MKIISVFKHTAKLILGREKIKFVQVSDNFYEKNLFYKDINQSKLASNNKTQFKKLVCIDGVGFSGSSAIGDFLGEFSNCTSLGGVDVRENPDRGVENSYEIDFIRQPGSLIDLERICNNNVERINDFAVHQFINVCNEYHKSGIPIYDDVFFELSKQFVKDITAYAFNSSPDHIKYCTKRLTINEYRQIVKQYMEKVLKNIPSNEFLVCDNLAAMGRPDFNRINDYLGECKNLLNYSDPRDIYARARLQPGNDWVPVDPEIFVQNWKLNYIPIINANDKYTLVTNFDDFCNDYETQAKKIMDFLGLEEKDHTQKFKYFNPKVSINNTGVWKKLENQKPVEYIFENLKEFCYDAENHKRYN